MHYSASGLTFTLDFEGDKLTAYRGRDGVWTIGAGHTRGVYEGMTITEQQAKDFELQDISDAESIVNKHVTVDLTQNEFDAIVDAVFNLGPAFVTGSTFIDLLNSGQYHRAASEFDKWDHCKGLVLPGLLRRRQAETTLFDDGIQNEGSK